MRVIVVLCHSAHPPDRTFFEFESCEFCSFNFRVYFCVCAKISDPLVSVTPLFQFCASTYLYKRY